MLAYSATDELQEAWPVVEKEIVLPVERERAWELMTEEPEEWLADEVELEPEPGAPLRATWDDGEERLPFAPPANSSDPMLIAIPQQIVCTSGLMKFIVS